MTKHKHKFERHVGIYIAGRTRIAWVRKDYVSRLFDAQPLPEMWRCDACGTPGYEIPVAA